MTPSPMRLFEAILEANHRALAGDGGAGLRPADFGDALPVVALTCIDPRLGPLMPEVLGIAEDQFIWLRNAGNIITSSLSSTMRSLALACAVKGGREIAVIGHTDCQVARTTMMQLLERFEALGLDRNRMPENLVEYFGLFASERQNVQRAVEFVRRSPLIGPRIPVHGLIVDVESGRLEWLVNGYQALGLATSGPTSSSHHEPPVALPPLGAVPAAVAAPDAPAPAPSAPAPVPGLQHWLSQVQLVPGPDEAGPAGPPADLPTVEPPRNPPPPPRLNPPRRNRR